MTHGDDVAMERHLVSTEAGYVHVRVSGSSTAGTPEFLLLHQVPNSSRNWIRTMHALAPLACVAPDMLNLGESDTTERALRLEEHAEYLWQAAQHVRPGPKIVVGHHAGSALAAILAAEHRDDVAALVLIGYPLYRDWRARLAKYERLNPLRVDADGTSVLAAWRFNYSGFTEGSDPELIFEGFADRMRAGRVWYEGYVALWNADLDGILGRARSLSRPTIVVAPDRDPLTPMSVAVADVLGVEVLGISGGSFVITEDSTVVADVLRELQARLSD